MKTRKNEKSKAKLNANKLRVWLMNRNSGGKSVSYCDKSWISNKVQLIISPG